MICLSDHLELHRCSVCADLYCERDCCDPQGVFMGFVWLSDAYYVKNRAGDFKNRTGVMIQTGMGYCASALGVAGGAMAGGRAMVRRIARRITCVGTWVMGEKRMLV